MLDNVKKTRKKNFFTSKVRKPYTMKRKPYITTYFKTRFYKTLQDRDNKLKYNKYKN